VERDILYGLSLIAVLLVTAIIAYHFLEGWAYLDSAYFAAATITTVGYGDLTPKTEAGKIFSIIYMLVGVSTGLYVLLSLGEHRERMFRSRFERVLERIQDGREKRRKKKREGRFVQEKFDFR
jgi:voltage-gated potassium channel Kch